MANYKQSAYKNHILPILCMTLTPNFLTRVLWFSRYLLAKIHFNSRWAWGSKSSLFPCFKIDAIAAKDPQCAYTGLSANTINWNKQEYTGY